jgi:hypothetical protein
MTIVHTTCWDAAGLERGEDTNFNPPKAVMLRNNHRERWILI